MGPRATSIFFIFFLYYGDIWFVRRIYTLNAMKPKNSQYEEFLFRATSFYVNK